MVVKWPKNPKTRVVDAFFMGQIYFLGWAKGGPLAHFWPIFAIFSPFLTKFSPKKFLTIFKKLKSAGPLAQNVRIRANSGLNQRPKFFKIFAQN